MKWMLPTALSLITLVLTGCASLLNGGQTGVEILSDPQETTVFVNGSQRGTTPFHYDYDPADGAEVMFELRKTGFTPSTFSLKPHMDHGVLFADAMLLGIPYIIDSKDPRLYDMPMAGHKVELYREVSADAQRHLVPISGLVLALGDRPDLGKADGKRITTDDDGLFRELSYTDMLAQAVASGLKDTWMDTRVVRAGTAKGDETLHRAKLFLEPKLERVSADLKSRRKRYSGPIELVVRWRVLSALDKDSLLFERVLTTTHHALAARADEALGDALRHAARRFSEMPDLPELVGAAQMSGLVRSKGSAMELSRPTSIPFEGRKDMLAALVKAVVTVQTEDGHGSGFLISNNGYLLTNQHVVEDESMVKVKFEQGFTLDAQVVKVNKDFDLALLKVQATDLPALTIGDDKGLMLGEEIFAIGTPVETSLGQSVARGILSGMRDIEGRSLLQTDVSINPGNSGGPLIDEKGTVVGVATLKISGKGLEGLGFGVPISVALEMLNITFVP